MGKSMKKRIILRLARSMTPGQILGLISELIEFAPEHHVHLNKTRGPRVKKSPTPLPADLLPKEGQA